MVYWSTWQAGCVSVAPKHNLSMSTFCPYFTKYETVSWATLIKAVPSEELKIEPFSFGLETRDAKLSNL